MSLLFPKYLFNRNTSYNNNNRESVWLSDVFRACRRALRDAELLHPKAEETCSMLRRCRQQLQRNAARMDKRKSQCSSLDAGVLLRWSRC